MGILNEIVRQGTLIKNRLNFNRPKAINLQDKTLKKLLTKAQNTKFGQQYRFAEALESGQAVEVFQKLVPIHDYSKMAVWWAQTLEGKKSVTWPGKIKYFALSSGTSEGSSKYIPVTTDMIKSIRRAGMKQLFGVINSDMPKDFIARDYLMIGGSTELEYNGIFYAGDLSGITTGTMPFWFQPFSKPEKEILRKRDWQQKLEEITLQAKNWDVGVVAGVPAWVQILFEKIIAHYKVNTIHDIWPNLSIYMHGGVSLEPYRKSLDKLYARPVLYFETYLASEGFIAFQAAQEAKGMKLLLKNGIFFEFIPFTPDNFNEDGELKENPEVLTIRQVDADVEYALLISTVSGAWRYLIGDTIRFVNMRNYEIIITGRTKHFVSMCGEHLSVDNMNHAIKELADDFRTSFNEFTVSGIEYEGLFAHHWFIGCDENLDPEKVRLKLDAHLKVLNDDYRVERTAALKEIRVELVPTSYFNSWLKTKGREGGQTKFPRVLKKTQYEDWKNFIAEKRQLSN
jgi:hypothetical protein